MRSKVVCILTLYFLLVVPLFSQEKSKKELKKEKQIEMQKAVENLVESKVFTFIARTANPQGARSVNLASNPNYVNFNPDLTEGKMPFFGRAYSGVSYSGNVGIEFSAKPDQYEVEKSKNKWMVKVVVKGGSDTYRITLDISSSGLASMTIISNNRSTISYNGELVPTGKK